MRLRNGLRALTATALLGRAMLASPQVPAEIATQDTPADFRARVNLVLVPVVVRDAGGRTVGGLRSADFHLFDGGKPQRIERFSVEHGGERITAGGTSPDAAAREAPAVPERFVAYLFDDLHLAFGELALARDAALTQMETLGSRTRAAIYSTSGQTMLEFTDDRAQWRKAVSALAPRAIGVMPRGTACPDIGYYVADLVVNWHDPSAEAAVAAMIGNCFRVPLKSEQIAAMVRSESFRALALGQQQTRLSLETLTEVIRRMAALPGQRTVVLISPGFITPEQQQEKSDLIDRAVRANVIVNALDARGLYTDPGFSASSPFNTPELQEIGLYRREAMAQADVLADLSGGTGGTFFQNRNDLRNGFDLVAGAPEVYYVLGFSPQNLKLDGAYHALRVSVQGTPAATVAARRGYFAPRRMADAAETARREIEEALFSREEMHDLPVDMKTQFFRTGEDSATLSVVTRLQVKGVGFRLEDDRHRNTVTIVIGLFDRNGNFMSALTKTVEFRLKPETLARISAAGLALKTTFAVKPGIYAIRLVARDAEGQLMAAENGSIEIP
jgi:VWFA-related protein